MSKASRRLISGIEVIGGVFGLFILANQFPSFRLDLHVVMLAPIATAVFLLSVVAGVLLWREHPAGRAASIVVQAIQLPKLVSPLLIFLFSFGFDFYPYVQVAGGDPKVGVDFKLAPFYNLYLNTPGTPIAIGISIPAIVFLIVLFGYKPVGSEERPIPPPPPAASEWGDDGRIPGNRSDEWTLRKLPGQRVWRNSY
jgi:hypothetical protein